jgi:hypothetical protein
MIKKYLLLILLFSYSSYSQVGIGTTNPQNDLHVAGNNATIRIEGLDSTNDALNTGTELIPVYVDNLGNFTLEKPSYISGGTGYALPLNFLMDTPNFVPDNLLGLPAPHDKYGNVINSDATNQSTTGLIHKITINVPSNSMIEVKHAMSIFFSSTDLTIPPYSTPITDEQTISIQTFFCFDIDSDGLSPAEYAIQYGTKGQYYASAKGGTNGYPYMNSQGYASLPAGMHTIYFFGVVNDAPGTFTSIGFGGANEYLKIRVF